MLPKLLLQSFLCLEVAFHLLLLSGTKFARSKNMEWKVDLIKWMFLLYSQSGLAWCLLALSLILWSIEPVHGHRIQKTFTSHTIQVSSSRQGKSLEPLDSAAVENNLIHQDHDHSLGTPVGAITLKSGWWTILH